jgi:hypothetical protein
LLVDRDLGIPRLVEEALDHGEVVGGRLALLGDLVLGAGDLRLLVGEARLGLVEVGVDGGLVADDGVLGGHPAHQVGGRLRLDVRREGLEPRVTLRVEAGDRVLDLPLLELDGERTLGELGGGKHQLMPRAGQRDLHPGVLVARLGEPGPHVAQVTPGRGELRLGVRQVGARPAQRLARVLEVVVDGVDLLLDATLLVLEVVVGEGGKRQRREDDPGRRESGRERTPTGSAGEEAHGSASEFGEVNPSTVGARTQTLMYLRVSRSVGTIVSTGPRMTMPGGR